MSFFFGQLENAGLLEYSIRFAQAGLGHRVQEICLEAAVLNELIHTGAAQVEYVSSLSAMPWPHAAMVCARQILGVCRHAALQRGFVSVVF